MSSTFLTLVSLYDFLHFKNGPEYITSETAQMFNPFDKISATQLGFKKLSRSSDVLFFLFSSIFFNGVCFQYFQVVVVFFLSKYS